MALCRNPRLGLGLRLLGGLPSENKSLVPEADEAGGALLRALVGSDEEICRNGGWLEAWGHTSVRGGCDPNSRRSLPEHVVVPCTGHKFWLGTQSKEAAPQNRASPFLFWVGWRHGGPVLWFRVKKVSGGSGTAGSLSRLWRFGGQVEEYHVSKVGAGLGLAPSNAPQCNPTQPNVIPSQERNVYEISPQESMTRPHRHTHTKHSHTQHRYAQTHAPTTPQLGTKPTPHVLCRWDHF